MGSDKGDGLALAQPEIAGRGVDVEIVDAGDGLNAPFGRRVEGWAIIQCCETVQRETLASRAISSSICTAFLPMVASSGYDCILCHRLHYSTGKRVMSILIEKFFTIWR